MLVPVRAQLTIGYFDSSRELYGFSGSYISQARQFLVDEGHTLLPTNVADATFLSKVDAFYTGLISSVSAAEVAAMQDFVDIDGGFLFIQTDYSPSPWNSAANTILSNWGIAHGDTHSNDSGHVTVGSSEWVTNPNVVTGFSGKDHSIVTAAPATFEILAKDSADQTILGVFDAGAGRSSDVLVATDIDFWSGIGWSDTRNRDLWENIWAAAADQIDPPVSTVPDAGSTLLLLGAAMASLYFVRRKVLT